MSSPEEVMNSKGYQATYHDIPYCRKCRPAIPGAKDATIQPVKQSPIASAPSRVVNDKAERPKLEFFSGGASKSDVWNYSVTTYVVVYSLHGVLFLASFYLPIVLFEDYSPKDSVTMLAVAIGAGVLGYAFSLLDAAGTRPKVIAVGALLYLYVAYNSFQNEVHGLFSRHAGFVLSLGLCLVIASGLLLEVTPSVRGDETQRTLKRYALLGQVMFLCLPIVLTIAFWYAHSRL
jgi:H+/Cl- antiporter ClcA